MTLSCLALRAAAGGAPAGCAPPAPAPLDAPAFVTVGAEAIPRGVVAALAQDAAGFVWIATGDGLVRHDGFRFAPVERAHPDPSRRNLGWIQALLADPDGRLWIGTETDGLAVYDPATDAVRDLGSAKGGLEAGPHPTVRGLARTPDGTLWLATLGGGLQRLRPAQAQVEGVPLADPAGAPLLQVTAVLGDERGQVWVGTRRGLYRGPDAQGRWQPLDGPAGLAQVPITALHRDAGGRLWAGTEGGGLASADTAEAPWRWAVPPGASPGPVSALASTRDGRRLWVGRVAGIDVHDAASGCLLQRLRHDPSRPDGLAGPEVSSLMRDEQGAIWVGGFGLGLQRVEPQGLALRVRRLEAAERARLGHPGALDARALLAWPDGSLWAALHHGPVVQFDRDLRLLGRVHDDGPAWQALAPGSGQTAWLGRSGAVRQVDRRGRVLRTLAHAGGGVDRLLEGADGTLWVGTQNGLLRWRPGDAGLQPVPGAEGRRFDGEVFALATAPDGALWIGTVQGLWRLPPGAAAAVPVGSPPGEGLAGVIVLALLFDRDGTLWVDTAVTGLHRMVAFDGRQARFDRVSARHGVLHRPFGVNLQQDGRGRLWTHMYLYDPRTDRLQELTAADGATQGTGWFRSHAALADGRLVFGGSHGLLVADPEAFAPPAAPVPLRWTGLRVDGRPRPAPPADPRVTLQPGERQLSVEFASLDFTDPQRTRYAHRLVGVDTDWVRGGPDFRVASYGNLPPGRYRLEVQASNRADAWTPQPLVLTVEVLPAWWQRPGVQALAVLAVMVASAAGVAALVRRRTRTLQRQRAMLEARVQARTAELEAATRQLRTQAQALELASLTDPLTGLRNRRHLSQVIDADVARIRRLLGEAGGSAEGPALLFMLVDIDHFKRVNDEHGHGAGDAVLRQMRARLLAVCRESDHVVRWGGEEFLVVVRDAGRGHARELAERLRRSVADTPFEVDGGPPLACTASIGFAAFPLAPGCPDALDWQETLSVADAALLAVKRSGRDGWAGVVACQATDAGAVREAIRPPAEAWPEDAALTVDASRPLQGPAVDAGA